MGILNVHVYGVGEIEVSRLFRATYFFLSKSDYDIDITETGIRTSNTENHRHKHCLSLYTAIRPRGHSRQVCATSVSIRQLKE